MKYRISFLKTALLITLIMGSINTIANDTIKFTLQGSGGIPRGDVIIIRVTNNEQFTVNWGDGTVDTHTGTTDNIGLYHTYADTNYYTVDITGSTTDCLFLNFECYRQQLISLDVTGAPNLITLTCSDNKLSSLDLGNNTALQYLYCNNNRLSSLDVSNNTAFRHLNCYINQLSSLDLSNNVNLQTLICASNQLSSLNVNNNIALIHLDCSDNQLSRLDLNRNAILNYLFCLYNRLPLSDLYVASKKINYSLGYHRVLLGTQRLLLQTITIGDTVDFSEQVAFGNPDTATVFVIEKDSLPAAINIDYTINNGVIIFNKKGYYAITMTNKAIVSDTNYPTKVIAEVHVSNTGIVKNALSEITVYPNPTTGELRITSDNSELQITNYEIYDILGKKQYSPFEGGRGMFRIDISHLPVGIYVVKVETEKGIIMKKIIKEY